MLHKSIKRSAISPGSRDLSKQVRSISIRLLSTMASLVLVGMVAIMAQTGLAKGAPTQAGGSGSAGAVHAPSCDPTWEVVSGLGPTATYSSLKSVAVLSANDAWAVGACLCGTGETTLTEHWDGVGWSRVPSPNVQFNTILVGVAAVSAGDVWAVGYYNNGIGTPASRVIEHWNGSAWSIVNSPNPADSGNNLTGVVAPSATDVWAVGAYFNHSTHLTETLVEHWDGSSWSVVNSPNRASRSHSTLTAVALVSPDDIWALGSSDDGPAERTLLEHWDGSAWTLVSSPSPGTWNSILQSLAIVSANDVWAVGYYIVYPSIEKLTLIEHWNGRHWSVVDSPNPSTVDNVLNGVAVISTGDVWAVGTIQTRTYGPFRTLIEHWDGTGWSVVDSPSPGLNLNELIGIAVTSATSVWAVGNDDGPFGSAPPLVERLTPCATTPTPTSTPIPTPQPSPTPAPCIPGTFTDMPANSPFYPYVTCLVNRSIISGYGDCTFRANNLVTRSQLAKIVSNSAGFQEDPGAQIFEDVPPASPFYQWINRLNRRGFIGGYNCGSAGEPCLSGNKPYFRPAANATRGQTSKIVANTAGYVEEPSEQTFEDVPPTDTFYREIQRLTVRNIMGGYPCSGAAEPCISGKPYFRPQNNVTRGQSAKIVANTFYPNCVTP